MEAIGKFYSERVLGCIVGGAIGDAAGSAFENSDTLDCANWLARPWRLTDDTQLTLATCEALTSGRVDAATIADSLLGWYRSRRLVGLGSSTLKALRDLDAGLHWALSGRKGDRAAGNGAAMRIAPVAFLVDPEEPYGRTLIRDICRITHDNDEAYIGALAIVLAIRASANSENLSLHELAQKLPDSIVRDRLQLLANLDSSATIARVAELGTSGFVADTVPLALFSSRQVFHIGFQEMLNQVISVGGDTDSIASISCQLAGAAIGLSSLPFELVGRIPEFEVVKGIAMRFASAICVR